jgi:hypothetical protein
MYDIQTIVSMNRAAGKKARPAHGRKGKQPFIATVDGDIDCAKIPMLGDYQPKGWDLIETHFVDSSGFGSDNEPALSIPAFIKQVKAGHGYAIVSAGQFQVHIGEFTRE